MIDVLLVSPRLTSSDQRRVGDHTYTDMLLAYPPDGVRYHHYEDLISQGQMRRIRSLQLLGHNLTRAGLLPPDMWAEYLTSDEQPDLVHIYGFSASVRLPVSRQHVPVVLGNGTCSVADLRYYLGWEEQRIKRARLVKRWYLRATRTHDSSLHPERAAHIVTWSNFSKQMHLDEGYVRPEQISTLYPGLPTQPEMAARKIAGDSVTFLFVGRDFERKNGALVLNAFRKVHATRPATRLLLVTHPTDGSAIVEPGVEHHRFVPHDELMRRIFPQADVLLLPSKAEGFGLVIVEAMSMGLAAIAVDAWSMPEIVIDGESGFLIRPDSLEDLTDAMTNFVARPGLATEMGRKGLVLFRARFSIEAHNRQLAAIYDRVLGERS